MLLKIVSLLCALWQNAFSQPWNYTDAGADWTFGSCSDPSNLYQSPINIEIPLCDCTDKMNLELNFAADKTVSGVLSLDGVPQTLTTALPSQFLNAFLRTNKTAVKIYRSTKMIFRTPSEHIIDSKIFPLELQIFLNSNDDDQIGMAILFDYSDSNSTNVIFDDFQRATTNITNMTSSPKNRTFGFSNYSSYDSLFADNLDFFYYNGSNSFGDCAPNLKWVVLQKVLEVNQINVTSYKSKLNKISGVDSNARIDQYLNDRVVLFSTQNCEDFFSNILWFSFLYGLVVFFVFKMI